MVTVKRSHKAVYFTSALFIFTSIGLGYSLYLNGLDLEKANEQLAEHREIANHLNHLKQSHQKVIEQNLVLETQLLDQEKGIERRDFTIIQQQQTIAKLGMKLDYAQRSEQEYKSKYRAQKQAISLVKEEADSQIAQEKQRLKNQTQEELKQQMMKLEGEYSSNALKEQNTKRVDELMSNFASLKVSLDVVNTCDKAYLERYGQAKSMLSHMRTYIQQNEMNSDYYYFVISNDAMISRKTRSLCLEN